MIRCTFALALVVALAGCAGARPVPDDAATELARLQRDLAAAADRHDRGMLERHLSPAFVLLLVRPGVSTRALDRAEVLVHWTEAGATSGRTEVAWQQVVLQEDTAVVFAEITDHWTEAGVEHRAVSRVSDTFVRTRTGWLWLSSHETLIDQR